MTADDGGWRLEQETNVCLLWLHADPDEDQLTGAFAEVLSVPVESVDISTSDVVERNWQAPVLVTVSPIGGAMRQHLDIHLAATVAAKPSTEILAAGLARRLGSAVAYEALSNPPDSFWLVGPDGERTRARINDDESDGELTLYRILAVEQPVIGIPGLRVTPIPEVIRGYRMPTPLTDPFRNSLASATDGWRAIDRLAVWEGMITRLCSGWPPDAWYPAEYYREDLESRDELISAVEKMPEPVKADFTEALAVLDGRFTDATTDDGGKALAALTGPVPDRWWWHRITDPLPWHSMPGS